MFCSYFKTVLKNDLPTGEMSLAKLKLQFVSIKLNDRNLTGIFGLSQNTVVEQLSRIYASIHPHSFITIKLNLIYNNCNWIQQISKAGFRCGRLTCIYWESRINDTRGVLLI